MSSGTGSNYPAPVVAGESAGINQAFQPFPYPNATQAASNAFSGIQGLVNPTAVSGLNNAASQAIGYGQSLPGQLAPVAQQGLAAGTQQYSTLAPYVGQALQAGFDPQNQLYNQLFGQQQQQNLASQAMAGVGGSPYGAGLTAQGNQNFDINWQNQQLARQAQGAQTAEGLSSTAMGDLTSGINNYLGATGLGISGMEGLLSTGGNLATQAQGLSQQQISDYLAYLSGNTANASAATGAQLGALNAGTSLYGATNQGNLAQQQLTNQSLGGLGQLGGTLGGAAILGSLL
jgi:hypothetical protein